MPHFKYLIIGGGMTADAAVDGIRQVDANGSIAIIGDEKDSPYNRPPLTKGLWKGETVNSISRHTEKKPVTLRLGRTIKKIQPKQKRVTDDAKNTYTYDKLLLATGGRVRLLPFGEKEIIYYRNLNDYRRLRQATAGGKRFVVIGSGFIGSEIAAALAMNKKQVTMVFPGKSIGERLFPADLSQFLNDFYKEKGVELVAGENAAGVTKRRKELILKTSTGRELSAAAIIAGVGIEPNVELAKAAGLEVDNGIIVDEFLRTADPDIYAAGDVAAFFNPALKKRMRVEHEDNANTMGNVVGRNLAGRFELYYHLPFFYSLL